VRGELAVEVDPQRPALDRLGAGDRPESHQEESKEGQSGYPHPPRGTAGD
jgi:hypothetical protein